MTSPFADRLFRVAFGVAGVYNLMFGLWIVIWPLAFFESFDLDPPGYPGIWACLGMVVGVFGLLYWHAAWRLETARPIIAVGLLGKVLVSIGMFATFSGDWPQPLGMLCIWSDVIWWLPFGLFLFRGTAVGRRIADQAPWFCVALHLVALAMMALVLRHGTIPGRDSFAQAKYIAEHRSAWVAGWVIWMLAAMSIVGFYAWWGSRLVNSQRRSRRWITWAATISVLFAGAGMCSDLTGEGLWAFAVSDMAQGIVERGTMRGIQNLGYSLTMAIAVGLTAGIANLLYSVGGLLLMIATPSLPWWIRLAMCGTWAAGGLMSYSAYLTGVDGSGVNGVIVATVVLFPLLIFWVTWMALRWRPS